MFKFGRLIPVRALAVVLTVATAMFLASMDYGQVLIKHWMSQLPAALVQEHRADADLAPINGLLGAGSKALPALIAGLDDPEYNWAAAEILGRMGPAAGDAAPALREMATQATSCDWAKGYAFNALRRVTPEDTSLPSLAAELIEHQNQYQASLEQDHDSLEYLCGLEPGVNPVMARLLAETERPSVSLLRMVTETGGRLDDVDKHLAQGICYLDQQQKASSCCLTSQQSMQATWAHDTIFSRPDEITGLLLKWHAEHESQPEPVREFVAKNIARYGDSSIPVTKWIIANGGYQERVDAIKSVGRYGENSVLFINDLAGALRQDRWLAYEVCMSLARMGEPGIEKIMEIAEWEDCQGRRFAIRSIMYFAEDIGPESVQLIFDLFVDADKTDRVTAVNFFRDRRLFAAEKQKLIPQCEALLDSEDENLAMWAYQIVKSLRYGGTDDYEDGYLGYCRAATSDPNPLIRQRAEVELAEEIARREELERNPPRFMEEYERIKSS